MKLLVDAMSAEFGGNRTHVDQLLRHWHSVLPDDEVHVLVPAHSTLEASGHVRHELAVPRPRTLFRPLAQTRELRRLVKSVRPDAVLATAPATTLRRLGVPLGVFVHDLRHELRPEQFSRGRRLIREVAYGRTFRIADGFIANSARTLTDLRRQHPGTALVPGVVVHHGADHVLNWPAPSRNGTALAFGQHTNKNPDLVLRAWSRALQRGDEIPDLTVVGASSGLRRRLSDIIVAENLSDRVTLAPFLEDEAFTRLSVSASMIVFPSDFEGFGLPILEGMLLGKPVVISPEPGSMEAAGGHATVMLGWEPDQLADAVVAAMSVSDDELRKAADWAATFTWEASVRKTGDAMRQLITS
jgi:glycosyltransferase involved in cell wall biosynthesis